MTDKTIRRYIVIAAFLLSFFLSTTLVFSQDDYTLIDTNTDGGQLMAVWGDVTYIYTAEANSGVFAYSFNGTTITYITGELDGNATDVWSDGTYIYVVYGADGLYVYSFNGTVFAELDNIDDGGNYLGVWGDGTYIYTGAGTSIHAYTFDGADLTLEGTLAIDVWSAKLWGDGTYIYSAVTTVGLYAYSFDGSDFTIEGSIDDGGSYDGIHGDAVNGYIYSANFGLGLLAYTFDGTNFTLEDTAVDSTLSRGVYWDGSYVHYAGQDLYAYTFDGSDFTLQFSDASTNSGRDVWFGAGGYVYVADDMQGLRAYSYPALSSGSQVIYINID